MESKFDFYEIVKVISNKPIHFKLKGKFGVIKGKVQNEKTGLWIYGVIVDEDEMRRFQENEIQTTGKKADPKIFSPAGTIKIRVNPETGEGEIVDDENETR